MLPSQTGTSEHTPKTHCFFVAGGSFLVSIWSSYGFCHLPLGVSLSCEKCGLVDAQQCLGLVPGDVLTARIFLQGLVGVRPRPEPREVFLRVQHLHLQIKSMR